MNDCKKKIGLVTLPVKKHLLFLSLIWFATALIPATAQEIPKQTDKWFDSFALQLTDKQKANNFYLVSFSSADCIDFLSLHIVRRLDGATAIIKHTDTGFSKMPCIKKWAPASAQWKLSPNLLDNKGFISRQNKRIYHFIIAADNIDLFLSDVKKDNRAVKLLTYHKAYGIAEISCKADLFFDWVLQHPAITFADMGTTPSTDFLLNGFVRHINSVNQTQYYWPLLNGKGITIGIKEKMPNNNDLDLLYRVRASSIADAQSDNHATTIATLAGGAGNSYLSGKGVAWGCNFFPSSFSNLFPDSALLLQQQQVWVQSHAYGTVIQPFYGAEAMSYDRQCYSQPNLLHVFSSGNQGKATSTTGNYAGIAEVGNLTGNFKMAKNVITVAAVDTGGVTAAFSSSGPLFDGRLGPQITALGPNGTSEAAAVVTGGIAVLQQLYKDSTQQQLPPASLLKAVIYNSADDIGSKGIDYRTGFGLFNLYHSVHTLQQKKFTGSAVGQSEFYTKRITLPSQSANLKITLCWTDTAAQLNTNKALVNDLDIEVTAVSSGIVYKPWCLSIFPRLDSLRSLPLRRRDSLNTAEQVSIDLPEPGDYIIKVIGHTVTTTAQQPFHIAWSVDTLPTFRFTNPVTAGDVEQEESPVLKIKWETAPPSADATGSLAVSYDEGIHWQELSSNISLLQKRFFWQIPDTAAFAQLRMQCSFGTFYSEKFVIAPLTVIQVDYLCADSMRLTWPTHFEATRYRLYALTDSAYLKPIMNIADSFVVLNRIAHPEITYAVEPILPNGIKARRSYAVNVLNQGVACYYKTLVGEMTGDSIKLSLELSFITSIDSIAIYKVLANGSIVRQIVRSTINPAQSIYYGVDNSPDAGQNYYRATIYLQGTAVNTEVIAVLHPGNNLVWVYPNPVKRGSPIYMLVNTPTNKGTLQIFDATGQSMGQFPYNDSRGISTAAFPKGVYFFKFLGNSNFSGKFIVQ